MKKLILLGIFAFISTFSLSQSNWDLIEKELWNQKFNKSISLDEWYIKLQIEAGSIPNRLSAWYKKTSKISVASNKGIVLRFISNKLKIANNGNVYRKVILQNDSSDSLTIQRIDATIDGFQELFFIEGNWRKHRKNGTSTCGNSYYNQILEPYSQIDFELSNGGLNEGEIDVEYKISITLNEKTL